MRLNQNRSEKLRALCGELHADDGVDPRTAFTREWTQRESAADRKTRQLCKQAQRALAAALGGECGDARLRLAEVVAVEPSPDSSRLRVTVIVPPAGGTSVEWRQRFEAATGFLRASLARAITRKRVPELTFGVQLEAEGKA
jgi:ribosome-binding factor A